MNRFNQRFNSGKSLFTTLCLFIALNSFNDCAACHCFNETSKKVFSSHIADIAHRFTKLENAWKKNAPVVPTETIGFTKKDLISAPLSEMSILIGNLLITHPPFYFKKELNKVENLLFTPDLAYFHMLLTPIKHYAQQTKKLLDINKCDSKNFNALKNSITFLQNSLKENALKTKSIIKNAALKEVSDSVQRLHAVLELLAKTMKTALAEPSYEVKESLRKSWRLIITTWAHTIEQQSSLVIENLKPEPLSELNPVNGITFYIEALALHLKYVAEKMQAEDRAYTCTADINDVKTMLATLKLFEIQT